MKYKQYILLAVLFAMSSAIYFTMMDKNILKNRIIQHQRKDNPLLSTKEDATHLPIVHINTDGKAIAGEPILDEQDSLLGYTLDEEGNTMTKMHVSIMDHPSHENSLDAPATIDTAALVRYRGNSSRHFDKKGYLLRFIDEQGFDNRKNVMNMGSESEWVLHGPFLDKTLMRNYLCMNIIGQVMPYTSDVAFCRLYVDGDYKGLYLMMESIKQGEQRVAITKNKANDTHISYIVRVDADPKDIRGLDTFSYYTHITQDHQTRYSIEYPGTKNISEAWKAYIEDDISKFEKALFSYDFKDEQQGYKAYIDVDSFVDYYVFMEFFGVRDFGSRSTYLYKDAKGKLCMGPVWDFNNAMDNFFLEQPTGDIQYQDRLWYRMLLKDEEFVDKIVYRYHDLRNSILNEDYLFSFIDDTSAFLGQEIKRNYDVWGYSFDVEALTMWEKLTPDERNITSFEDAIIQMKTYIHKRGNWLDTHIETLYQYCHDSKNKDILLK